MAVVQRREVDISEGKTVSQQDLTKQYFGFKLNLYNI